MKYLITYVFILLLIFSRRSLGQEAFGYLRIDSGEPVIQVLVGDSVYAYSERLRLPVGNHTVMICNPDRISFQAQDFVAIVDIRSGEESRIQAVFEKLAEINSYPPGAEVYINNELAGITPFYLPLSRHKDGVLHFRKKGYTNEGITVTDSSIARNSVKMYLRPEIAGRIRNQNQFVNLEWQDRGPYRYREEIMITQGLCIVFGAGAAYYKKQADDSFEKAKIYRRLGELQKKDRQLKKTKRYDRYAVVGLVGMQVNAAALIYYLFKSK